MDLRSVYIANGVGLFILLVLLYVSRTKILRKRTEDRLFFYMLIGVMIACFMEVISYALDGHVFPGSRILNYIANTYLYSVNLLLPFCLLMYVDIGLYDDKTRIWKHYKPQIIIGAAMFAMNIVNFFIPISYVITEQNVYERRPFSYAYYFVILYYCISAIFLTQRYKKTYGAKPFFRIPIFLTPILLGAGLQFLFYGLSLAWLAASIGLTGLFMMQQNEVAYIDALVDTYNRQYLNHIFSSWMKRGDGFSGCMIDVDHFKQINDIYGHSEGDRALKEVAKILNQSRKENEWVFRFAGDEFIILKRTVAEDGLDSYMAEVNRRLEEYNRGGNHPYKLVLSYGTSYHSTGEIDPFLREMDEKMYRMKARHHAEEQDSLGACL